jgi:hypothetical protein
LGKFFTLFFSEPAIATNLLSAVCTSLAIGVMSLVILDFTQDIFSSLFVPLVFAFTPLIWSMAVITENYNVNLLFFGIAFFLALRHYKKPSFWKVLVCSVVFGLSLGVHLLNAVLLPFFLFLLYWPTRHVKPLFIFILGCAISGIAILSLSFFRAWEIAPLGTQYVPTTLTNYWNYLTCYQCDVVTVFGASYYIERVFEHTGIVLANYAYLGILLGIFGLISLWLEQRVLAVVFALIVGLELGYLTTYQSWEYYNMAGPAHFVFTLCMAFCGRWSGFSKKKYLIYGTRAVILALCAFLLLYQFPAKYQRALSYPVTEYVTRSFKRFPPEAVVVSEWSTFPALLYFQKIHHWREDLTLIEKTQDTRYYDFGVVSGYVDYVKAESAERPIVVERQDEKLADDFSFSQLYKRWYLATER